MSIVWYSEEHKITQRFESWIFFSKNISIVWYSEEHKITKRFESWIFFSIFRWRHGDTFSVDRSETANLNRWSSDWGYFFPSYLTEHISCTRHVRRDINPVSVPLYSLECCTINRNPKPQLSRVVELVSETRKSLSSSSSSSCVYNSPPVDHIRMQVYPVDIHTRCP
jgi:hypothetical protein